MPVIKQHYVPQFIMRNFADENGWLCVIDKKASPMRVKKLKTNAILAEKDMYETKNSDGSYFNRNGIENKFAQIEGQISNILREVDRDLFNKRILSTNEECAFALFIALQLVRLPKVREIIKDSPKGDFTNDADKETYDRAIYRMMLQSRESGFEYLKENGLELSEETKEKLKGKSLLEDTTSFIFSNCAIYVLIAPNDTPYVLSDMPVLIDSFSDAKYIFPVTPQIAICCRLFEESNEREFGGFIQAQSEWIEKINKQLCDKANRWIICKSNYSSYILNLLTR